MICSGSSFSPPFLRFVTFLFLRILFSPFGLSIMSMSQPLLTRDCSSSQRVVTASPCFRKSCRQQHVSHSKRIKNQDLLFSQSIKAQFLQQFHILGTSSKLNLCLCFHSFSIYFIQSIQFWYFLLLAPQQICSSGKTH